MSYSVIRSHEICAGHRVVGHESKCRHLHGHNYVFHFKVQPKSQLPGIKSDILLDTVGRVIDFSVVKSTLCEWLEDNWDHKFLHWEKDPVIKNMKDTFLTEQGEACVDFHDAYGTEETNAFYNSFVALPFNPTAENLAAHMVNVVGPMLLAEHGVELVQCTIEETSKCHVEYNK